MKSSSSKGKQSKDVHGFNYGFQITIQASLSEIRKYHKPGAVVHASNPSTQETSRGASEFRPGWSTEFQVNQQ